MSKHATSQLSCAPVALAAGLNRKGATNLQPQRNLLQLAPHAVKLLDVSASADEIFGLYLACAHLALLCALLDLTDQRLFLLLKLHALLVKLSNGFIEEALILP